MKRSHRTARYTDLDNAAKDLAYALVKLHEGKLVPAFLNAAMALVHISKHLTAAEYAWMLRALKSPKADAVPAQSEHQRQQPAEEHVLPSLGDLRVGGENPKQQPNDQHDERDDGD